MKRFLIHSSRLIPGLAFLVVLVQQTLEHTVLLHLAPWEHFVTQLVFYGIMGPALAWWALKRIQEAMGETEQALATLQQTNLELQETSQRLEFLMRVNHRLANQVDEEGLIQAVLALPQEIVPTLGVSLIRMDEREQPLPAIHQGDLPPDLFEAWAQHVSSVDTPGHCAHCQLKWATDAESCPLLVPQFDHLVKKVYCLALERAGRTFGILNIFLADASRPTAREAALLEALASEISLAFEMMHLRSRELDMLYRLEQVRPEQSLQENLEQVLKHTVKALNTQGGVLFLHDEERGTLTCKVLEGSISEDQLSIVQAMVQGGCASQVPVNVHSLEPSGAGQTEVRAVLAVPLLLKERVLGGMALWDSKTRKFTSRQVQLVATVAGLMALLIENHELYLEAAFHAAMAERGRLAREIHDGLAQTLGYLNLRVAQILTWLEKGEVERAKSALADARDLLFSAYVDAREAIDSLRLQPEAYSLQDWFQQVLDEFTHLCPVRVDSSPVPDVELPPEVHVQLQRIVQEALSNIRKHADATRVKIRWTETTDHLELHISDNGRGFDLDDVPPIARHGLRIMKERAELLGGQLDIQSQPGMGTHLVLRIPLRGMLPDAIRKTAYARADRG